MYSITNDIRNSLKNKCYLSALALTLTIPDICSQIESHKDSSDRWMYINWFNKHVEFDDFHFPAKGFERQTFDGNMCYALRCKVLHNGNLELKETDSNLRIRLDLFEFTTPESTNYYHGYQYVSKALSNGKKQAITSLAIDYLCETICDAAENFYRNWEQKEDFNKHKIVFK